MRCGFSVEGTLDHCPQCLWSKHVAGKKGKHCGGAMEPRAIELGEERCMIVYQCMKCAHRHKQKSAVVDSFEALSKLSIHENEALDLPDSEDLEEEELEGASQHR